MAGDRVDSSRNGSQFPKSVRCSRSDEGAAKGALCDDFDDDDEDLQSDSKHPRSLSSYHAVVGGCKKEFTVQRDQDKTGVNLSKLHDNNSWGNRGSDGTVSRMSQSQSSRGSSVDAARRGQGQGRGLHMEDAEFADIDSLFDSNILEADTSWDADRDHKIREGDRVPVINGTSSSSSSSSSAFSSRTIKSASTYCNRAEYDLSSDAVRPTGTPMTCISQSLSQSVNGGGRASGTAAIPIPIPVAVSASCKAR